jgi:hypothetical protein
VDLTDGPIERGIGRTQRTKPRLERSWGSLVLRRAFGVKGASPSSVVIGPSSGVRCEWRENLTNEPTVKGARMWTGSIQKRRRTGHASSVDDSMAPSSQHNSSRLRNMIDSFDAIIPVTPIESFGAIAQRWVATVARAGGERSRQVGETKWLPYRGMIRARFARASLPFGGRSDNVSFVAAVLCDGAQILRNEANARRRRSGRVVSDDVQSRRSRRGSAERRPCSCRSIIGASRQGDIGRSSHEAPFTADGERRRIRCEICEPSSDINCMEAAEHGIRSQQR